MKQNIVATPSKNATYKKRTFAYMLQVLIFKVYFILSILSVISSEVKIVIRYLRQNNSQGDVVDGSRKCFVFSILDNHPYTRPTL